MGILQLFILMEHESFNRLFWSKVNSTSHGRSPLISWLLPSLLLLIHLNLYNFLIFNEVLSLFKWFECLIFIRAIKVVLVFVNLILFFVLVFSQGHFKSCSGLGDCWIVVLSIWLSCPYCDMLSQVEWRKLLEFLSEVNLLLMTLRMAYKLLTYLLRRRYSLLRLGRYRPSINYLLKKASMATFLCWIENWFVCLHEVCVRVLMSLLFEGAHFWVELSTIARVIIWEFWISLVL